jgi:hypothetical protein
MARTELVLRPGDTASVKLELAGQALRLDLSLTHDELVIAPPPARKPTRQIAPPPVVAPPPPAFEPAQEVEFDAEEDTSAPLESAQAVHEQDQDIDFDVGDLEGPSERAPRDSSFSPHGMTMVPPTAQASPITLDDSAFEEAAPEAAPQSPAFVAPSQPMDTLPAWQGGARAYRDPVLEKKKATAMVKAPTGPIAPPADAWGDGQTVDDGGSGTIFSVGPSQAPKSAPGIIREGGYTVFLNPPKSDDKKQAAAKIIAQVQGIGIADALALAGKMIVPVAKDVSEQEAHGVRDMFKGIGLSCRITQKR